MPRPPLVSVILPTYNRGALLLEAIASVTGQTHPRWELIVVDDGSTDGSVEAIPTDHRVRVLRLEHTGNVARVRQAGLEAAIGDVVGFVDSDDLWERDKLTMQLARLAAEPRAGWCFADYRLVSKDGQEVPLRWGTPTTSREGWLFDALVDGTAGICLQTVVVRRPLALLVGFDPRVPFGEDLDFMIRLAHRSPACRVTALLASARDHPDRSTRHRYDQSWHLARAFWRYQRLTSDRAARRVCRARAFAHARTFLAQARANLGKGRPASPAP